MMYPVTTCEVPRVWEVIGGYLDMVFAKSPIPVPRERLYQAIIEDEKKLFLLSEGSKLKGIIILQIEDHLGIKVMNTYALACDRGYTKLEQDLEQTTEIARTAGCEYMLGYGRRGFSRTLPAYGFKHLQTVMVREV